MKRSLCNAHPFTLQGILMSLKMTDFSSASCFSVPFNGSDMVVKTLYTGEPESCLVPRKQQ